MSRFARQVDQNQALIIKGLRLAGASASSLAGVGGGVEDVLVGTRGLNFILEIKNPNRKPSARKLRPLQQARAESWKGQRATVETLVQALAVCGLQLPQETLIQLALEKAKGVVDGAAWVKAAAWGSRAVGIGLPFAPLPSPGGQKRGAGPFQRKGKGSAPVATENYDVGRTPTPITEFHAPSGTPPKVVQAIARIIEARPGGLSGMERLLLHELDVAEGRK